MARDRGPPHGLALDGDDRDGRRPPADHRPAGRTCGASRRPRAPAAGERRAAHTGLRRTPPAARRPRRAGPPARAPRRRWRRRPWRHRRRRPRHHPGGTGGPAALVARRRRRDGRRLRGATPDGPAGRRPAARRRVRPAHRLRRPRREPPRAVDPLRHDRGGGRRARRPGPFRRGARVDGRAPAHDGRRLEARIEPIRVALHRETVERYRRAAGHDPRAPETII